MESELTTFLTTIDTPAFRRNNLAKVWAKAIAAHAGRDAQGSAPAAGVPSAGLVVPTTRLQAAVSGE